MSAAANSVLSRAIDCLEILDKRPRPMCRDCADEDGTCPNGGLDCDMRKLIADARAAIAPPVAAGSVDMTALDEALDGWVTPNGALYRKIVAWGAQQREAGKAEEKDFIKECMVRGQDEFNRKWTVQKERAEKAEARVKELEARFLVVAHHPV